MESPSKKLHNNHNVYILGAGFSRLRGLPLMSDFMTQMRDALEYHSQKGHDRECRAIETVLEFRLRASSAAYRVRLDLENIEELFSLASASLNQNEDQIRLSISATLDYSINTKSLRMANFRGSKTAFKNHSSWTMTPNPYDEHVASWQAPAYEYIVQALIGDKGRYRDSIENTFITFNYDTILEDALLSLNVPHSFGFETSALKLDKPGVKVLKLHGSVNWAIPKGARTRVDIMDSYRAVVDRGLSLELVPPTWKKDSKGTFDVIWKESLRALSEATRVVVIGFSIPPTDMHFKYLLASGLQENYSLREIVFVNPKDGLEQVQERCQLLFANQEHNAAKVRFIGSTVSEFVGQGTGDLNVASIGRPLPDDVQGISF